MGNGKTSVVFFGTSEICIPFLESLKQEFSIPLIITQPDASGGRKNKLLRPPVKDYAERQGLKYIQPDKLDRNIAEMIAAFKPAIGVVISYGRFIPGIIFRIPDFNTVNVHFSLLPKLRGAAPFQRAIEMGLTKTGITVFEISSRMDAGDIWAQKDFMIRDEDTSLSLSERMGREGAPFLIETMGRILEKSIYKVPQDESRATFAAAVRKSEGIIDWKQNGSTIYNKFRAYYPWPGLSFLSDGSRITIKKMTPSGTIHAGKPGEIVSLDQNGLLVCCGDSTAIEIQRILPQGKKEMSPYTYSLGNRIPEILH